MGRSCTSDEAVRRPAAGAAGSDASAEAAPRAYLTPRAVADRLGLSKTDAVLSWIASGQLVAVNVIAGSGRLTWRIGADDLAAFLANRRARPEPPITRRRTRRPEPKVTAYF
jgi:hypothetical protein